jgi:acetyl-CoA C-acetyltransferase
MSIKGKVCIAGIYEHPTRHAPDKSVAQLHAEVAAGALADAGIKKADIDGYFCAGDAPGLGGLSMIDYLGLKVRHVDSTETGGSSYLVHVAHAAEAIATGRCSVALITLAGRPRSEGSSGVQPRSYGAAAPDAAFEYPYGPATCTPWWRCDTCMNSARPRSNSPGSRSPPRTMHGTIRRRCFAAWLQSRRFSTRP